MGHGGGGGWTLADAAYWLDPPITPAQLAHLVKAVRITPVGVRRPARGTAGGRPVPVYDITELIKVHAAIAEWLTGRRAASG